MWREAERRALHPALLCAVAMGLSDGGGLEVWVGQGEIEGAAAHRFGGCKVPRLNSIDRCVRVNVYLARCCGAKRVECVKDGFDTVQTQKPSQELECRVLQ